MTNRGVVLYCPGRNNGPGCVASGATPDFRLLWNKRLLISYLSAIYPADIAKFRKMKIRQLKAIILSVSKRG